MLLPSPCLDLNRWTQRLTVMTWLTRIPPQGAAVAAVLAAVLATTLSVHVHGLGDLGYALHQGAAQAFLGAALLLEVRIIRKHLLAFVDFQLGVKLLQLILKKGRTNIAERLQNNYVATVIHILIVNFWALITHM